MFPVDPNRTGKKLSLVLYGTRDEFKRFNKSAPWAEAFYLKPDCYAYFDEGRENPYHWMLHEATHQLAEQVSGFKRKVWIEEGLASYFATSRITEAGVALGVVDWRTYPAWGRRSYAFSGDMAKDESAFQFIALDKLIANAGGPDVDKYFNLYYMCAWSLTHFFFHYENGKYAAAYKQFLLSAQTKEDFIAQFGPLDRIQSEWYEYLRNQLRPMIG